MVEPDRVRAAQRITSCTGKALATILGLGANVSKANHARYHANVGSEAEGGHPQSRPVVTAASGIMSRASDALTDFLTPLVHMNTPRLEDQSTKEVLCQLAEAQQAIWQAGDIHTTVGSLDMRAL